MKKESDRDDAAGVVALTVLALVVSRLFCFCSPRRKVDPHALGRDGWQLRAAGTDAKVGIVVADFPALLGRVLSRTELRACQRAAHRLEARGKFRRLKLGYDGARMTHLQLA